MKSRLITQKFILYILVPRLNQYKDQRASYANFGFFSILGAKLKAIVISPNLSVISNYLVVRETEAATAGVFLWILRNL